MVKKSNIWKPVVDYQHLKKAGNLTLSNSVILLTKTIFFSWKHKFFAIFTQMIGDELVYSVH